MTKIFFETFYFLEAGIGSRIAKQAASFGVKGQTVKFGLAGAGIGAGLGVGHGAIKYTEADERVDHWKGKLRAATTPEEEELAKKKIEEWKKISKAQRFSNMKKYASRYAVGGGAIGAGAGYYKDNPQMMNR